MYKIIEVYTIRMTFVVEFHDAGRGEWVATFGDRIDAENWIRRISAA